VSRANSSVSRANSSLVAFEHGVSDRLIIRYEANALTLWTSLLFTAGPSVSYLLLRSYGKSMHALEGTLGVHYTNDNPLYNSPIIPKGFLGYRYHGNLSGVFRIGVAAPTMFEMTYGWYF
jgi:hypothetical protein